jgi:hypothetical protein
VCTLLHIATISGVLACLMRHFRASVASLPLLMQPLGSLPLGTWAADSLLVQQEAASGAQGQEVGAATGVGHRNQMSYPACQIGPDVSYWFQ